MGVISTGNGEHIQAHTYEYTHIQVCMHTGTLTHRCTHTGTHTDRWAHTEVQTYMGSVGIMGRAFIVSACGCKTNIYSKGSEASKTQQQ